MDYYNFIHKSKGEILIELANYLIDKHDIRKSCDNLHINHMLLKTTKSYKLFITDRGKFGASLDNYILKLHIDENNLTIQQGILCENDIKSFFKYHNRKNIIDELL